MKWLLVLLCACRMSTSEVEKMLGEHANCVAGYDCTFLCTKLNKSYICYPEYGGDGKLFCFEAVDSADLK